MPSRSNTRSARIVTWIEHKGLTAIGESEFQAMLDEFGVDPQVLRRIVRDRGMPLSPVVEGVRQNNLQELERTLGALAAVYEEAAAGRRQAIRELVITSKRHARLAARHAESADLKQEMILWMNIWLENPAAFTFWVALRKVAEGFAMRPEA